MHKKYCIYKSVSAYLEIDFAGETNKKLRPGKIGNKNKNDLNGKAGTLARPAFSFGREIFQDVWPGERAQQVPRCGRAHLSEGYAGTCSELTVTEPSGCYRDERTAPVKHLHTILCK